MDLGIKGKRALVCASSKGLGLGCAEALAEAGVDLVMNARGREALEAAAARLRETYGVDVTTVAADIATQEGQRAVIEAAGEVDILVNNAGGPPPGMWTDWDRDDFIKALDANMLAPIALIKALVPGMMERGWGRVVNITSQSVRAPIAVLGLSNAARTGLTGYVAGTSRQVAGKGVTINNLLPGIHATDRADALDGAVVARRKHFAGAGARGAQCDHSRRALRHAGGVRCRLCLPVLAACGLHRGAVDLARRWGDQHHDVMAEALPLKDQLFNPQSVGQLAAEHARALPGFDAERFVREALAGFPTRELMARMDWLADCLEAQLAPDFPLMADQLEAAMPPPLSPSERDDDFGQFIHAAPGILAARHGLEHHRVRAMALLHAATQRFTMEYALRPFLIRWPEETLADLSEWAGDPHYHVRRLVSEGTRPRLPWGQNVGLKPAQTLPLLDLLHGDPTRFVTRSVANHLNDLSKSVPEVVIERFARWALEGTQAPQELAWMKRHALRTLIKQGHAGALAAMGYVAHDGLEASIAVESQTVAMGGLLVFTVTLCSDVDLPVLVDYRIDFTRSGGKRAEKVFKLKTAQLAAGRPLTLGKSHRLRAGATTFTLYPGAHHITLQVNGRDVARATFTLV